MSLISMIYNALDLSEGYLDIKYVTLFTRPPSPLSWSWDPAFPLVRSESGHTGSASAVGFCVKVQVELATGY